MEYLNLVEIRIYRYEDVDGKQRSQKVRYEIGLENGKVKKVTNEFNHEVATNSEVFEYFSEKFNK